MLSLSTPLILLWFRRTRKLALLPIMSESLTSNCPENRYSSSVKAEEDVMMMPHMDDVDMFDFESTNHLIPRKTFSVISIGRPFGSRASLASRKRSMMFEQLRGKVARKQLD